MSRTCGPAFQICYLTDDLNATLRYWTGTLGIGPFFVLPPRTFSRYAYRGVETDDSQIIAAVALSYSGDMQIEIIVPGPSPSAYTEFVQAGHKGVHHLGFASRDFDNQLAAALDSGMSMVMEGSSPLARFAYLEGDPGQPGTILELIEMNEAIEGAFARIKAATIDWDGQDPIRHL